MQVNTTTPHWSVLLCRCRNGSCRNRPSTLTRTHFTLTSLAIVAKALVEIKSTEATSLTLKVRYWAFNVMAPLLEDLLPINTDVLARYRS